MSAGRIGAASCLMLAACSGGSRPATAYAPYAERGLASWYGEELAGGRTASGDRFDPAGYTAAHRTLPLGSIAEVTDLATGRAILVRINDRGPGRRDRLIDLSSGAARLLGTDVRSIAEVRVRALRGDAREGRAREGRVVAAGRPAAAAGAMIAPAAAGRYVVQVASFSSEDRARALAGRIDADVIRAGSLWRVRLGPFDAPAAQRARDAVAARGYADAHLSAAPDAND